MRIPRSGFCKPALQEFQRISTIFCEVSAIFRQQNRSTPRAPGRHQHFLPGRAAAEHACDGAAGIVGCIGVAALAILLMPACLTAILPLMRTAAKRTAKTSGAAKTSAVATASTVVSTKGQVILPQAIRKRRQWTAGTKLIVEDTPEGVLLKARPFFPPSKPEDVFGSLHTGEPAKTLEEMDAAIMEEIKRRHARGRY